MTVGDLISWLEANPWCVISYLIVMPLLALWLNWMTKDKELAGVWSILYSVLIYAICIPGIFAVSMLLHHLAFAKKGSVSNVNLLLHVAPAALMFVTIALIKKRTSLKSIPGFMGITGFMLILFGLMAIGWLLNKFRIVVFSYVPVGYLLLVLILLPVLIWIGWRKVKASA